jgi:tripartite-type tricarboxylate transporter receptor subunit TctC
MAGDFMGRRVARLIAALAGIAIASVAAPSESRGQDYPARSAISLVTGLVAGSITDVIARYLADKMGHLSGQTVLVINKPGANGIIAATDVTRAKPDGYTLLWAASSSYTSNQLMYKSLPYDPKNDLALISTVTRFGFMILVSGDNTAKTLTELTAALRQKGGGMYGASSTNMLAAAELYKFYAGLDTQQVLYKSTADSIRDLNSNQIDFAVVDAAFALAQVKTSHVSPLAITLSKRSVLAPEVPTVEETGLKDYEVSGWMALAAPAATPEPVLRKIRSWMEQIMTMPETSRFILDLGFEPFHLPPDQLNAFQDAQIQKWRNLIDIGHVTIQ